MTTTKQLTPIEGMRNSLKQLEPQFKAALPSHIPLEKFTRVIMTSVQQNPTLLQADKASFFAAAMKSAAQGLLPDGKEAAFVTFRNKSGDNIVQYMPMISGLLKLVRNSGELLSITSNIIYENDTFEYYTDTDGEHMTHKPNLFGDRGKILGAYALAKTKDGGVYIEVMTMNELEAVRNASRSKDSGPWAGSFRSEMQKKTVLRRLIKRLPVSTDLDLAIKADDELFELNEQPVQQQVQEEAAPKKRKSRMDSIVEQNEVDSEIDVTPKNESINTENPL